MINKFMQQKIDGALKKASSDKYKQFILKNGELLSNIGVGNERDLRKFHHISQLVPILVRRALGSGNRKIYSEVGKYIFEKYLTSVNGIDDLQKKVILALDDLNLKKIGYPIGNLEPNPIKSYDVKKWISAANEMYMKMRLFGTTRQGALYAITKGWNDMEKNNFEHWLRYYEEGANKVYKKAQYTTGNGVTLPTNNTNPSMRRIPGMMQPQQQEEPAPQQFSKSQEEAAIFQKTKASLIGRINSAIKILSSDTGRKLSGAEYEKLLRALTDLQYDVLRVSASDMLKDVIVRAANTLKYEGDHYGSKMIIKIAQEPDPLADLDLGEPAPSFDNIDAGNGENSPQKAIIDTLNELGYSSKENILPNINQVKKQVLENKKQNEPPLVPEPPPPPPESVPESPEEKDPLDDKPEDEPEEKPNSVSEDKKASSYAWATYKTAELKTLENLVENICSIASTTREIYKNAQMPNMIEKEEPENLSTNSNVGENAIDKALENIQVSDVVRRLQALSRVFKNREIARQLSIIDLMLDKLGIAGLFPQLAEATRSALESNQYTSVRIDEILSKLMSVIDESGKVKVTIQQEDDESLVDKEMKDALQQSDALEGRDVETELPEGAPEGMPAPRPVASPARPVTPTPVTPTPVATPPIAKPMV